MASEGFIAAKRGLQQDDPLSPYLFVFCMEVFSQLLNKADLEGKIIYHPLCAKLKLTHLSFADDLMIFASAQEQSLQGIKGVLQEFYHISDLQVNYAKSEIFCCNVANPHCLTAIKDIKVGNISFRYLGVPLFSKKLRDVDCKPLMDKIIARIKSSTARFFSYASRLQLISSILFSMYNCWCSVVLLPKKIAKEVGRRCSSFLWKGFYLILL